MGRPPLADREGVKRSTFSIRITASERAAIERAAQAEGESASEWARRILLSAAHSQPES